VTIKKSDSSSNAIVLGGTIDGVVNRTLANEDDSIVIQSDGTEWFRPMLTASGNDDYANAVFTVGALVANTATVSATNIIVDGKDFSASSWVKSNVTVLADNVVAPDGTLTGDKLTTTATSGYVYQELTGSSASSMTISCSFQQGNGNTQNFGLYDQTAGAWMLRMAITWAAGVATSIVAVGGAGSNFTITSQGGGWYLISGNTTGAWIAGRTLRYYIYPGWLGEPGFPSSKYVWNARCYPTVNAISATGPVAITGNVAITGTLGITSTITASSLTASRAVFTDASKNLVSIATTGSGSVVLAISPTITGTANIAGITYTTALGSLTAYATPSAFTQTLSSQFASTVSGATLMGYGTTGDVTLKGRSGNDAFYVAANTLNCVAKGSMTVTTGFGCNAAAAQTAYASGGALNAYVTGGFGLDSDANMSALHGLVVNIRAALVSNGIMS
jgi:hypothetical protein